MQEMAESGAKVLHARAVEFAKQRNIAIFARKTEDFTSQSHGRETRVHARAGSEVHAVVVDRKLALARIAASAVPSLLLACSDAGLTLRDSVATGSEFFATLPLAGVPAAAATLAALAQRVPGLELETDVGALSAVGVGAGAEAAELAGFLSTLGVSPRLLVATPLRVTAVLPSALLGAAEQALHARFFPR
jgi:aspartate kinase